MAPQTTRELLIAEAIGDAARLIQQVEALAPALDQSRQALADAHDGLAGQLAAFQAQVLALTEKSKVVAVRHIMARSDEVARQSAALQSRAVADAARVALGAEVGAALQRLQSIQEQPAHRWLPWLTHAAAALAASAATWVVALMLWPR